MCVMDGERGRETEGERHWERECHRKQKRGSMHAVSSSILQAHLIH